MLGQLSFVLSFSLSLLSVLLFQHSIPTGHMGTFSPPGSTPHAPTCTLLKEKKHKFNLCCLHIYQSTIKLPVTSLTKKQEFFLTCSSAWSHHLWRATPQHPITIFKFLMTSCLSYFPPHNHKSSFPALQSAGAQIMELHMVSSNSTDHR